MAHFGDTGTNYPSSWIADTGATCHMTDNLQWLSTLEPLMANKNFPHRIQAYEVGDLIHNDLGSPLVMTFGGSQYYILFKDDATTYQFPYCMK